MDDTQFPSDEEMERIIRKWQLDRGSTEQPSLEQLLTLLREAERGST